MTIKSRADEIPILEDGQKAKIRMASSNLGLERLNRKSVADVAITIKYKIRIIPFIGKMSYNQRFIAITNESGFIHWNATSSD